MNTHCRDCSDTNNIVNIRSSTGKIIALSLGPYPHSTLTLRNIIEAYALKSAEYYDVLLEAMRIANENLAKEHVYVNGFGWSANGLIFLLYDEKTIRNKITEYTKIMSRISHNELRELCMSYINFYSFLADIAKENIFV